MKLWQKFDNAITRISKWAILVSVICIIYMMLSATLDIITTKFFDFPLPNTKEIIEDLNIPLVFMGIAYVQLHEGHIAGGVFDRNLSKVGKRAIQLTSNIIGVFVSGFISYTTFLMVKGFIANNSTKMVIPDYVLWPFGLVLLIGMILLTLAYIVSVVRVLLGQEASRREEAGQISG